MWASVTPTRPTPMITKCAMPLSLGHPGRGRTGRGGQSVRDGLPWGAVQSIRRALRRALVGKPVHNERFGDAVLPKRTALPVFSADASPRWPTPPTRSSSPSRSRGPPPWRSRRGSGLARGGGAHRGVAAYRQNVRAYPSGGGDYEMRRRTSASAPGWGWRGPAGRLRPHGGGVDRHGCPVHRHRAPRAAGRGRCSPSASSSCRAAQPARCPGVGPRHCGARLLLHGVDRRDRRRGRRPWLTGSLRTAERPPTTLSLSPASTGARRARGRLPGAARLLLGAAALTGVEAIATASPRSASPARNAAATLAAARAASRLHARRGARAGATHRGRSSGTRRRSCISTAPPARTSAGPGDRAVAKTVFGGFPSIFDRRAAVGRADLCSPPTPRSPASPCWRPSWPGTASCPGSCTPGATGSRSPTAS